MQKIKEQIKSVAPGELEEHGGGKDDQDTLDLIELLEPPSSVAAATEGS